MGKSQPFKNWRKKYKLSFPIFPFFPWPLRITIWLRAGTSFNFCCRHSLFPLSSPSNLTSPENWTKHMTKKKKRPGLFFKPTLALTKWNMWPEKCRSDQNWTKKASKGWPGKGQKHHIEDLKESTQKNKKICSLDLQFFWLKERKEKENRTC